MAIPAVSAENSLFLTEHTSETLKITAWIPQKNHKNTSQSPQNQRKRDENKVQPYNEYSTNFPRHLATHTRHTLPSHVGIEFTKWNNEIDNEPPHDPHTRDATTPQRHVTYGYHTLAPRLGLDSYPSVSQAEHFSSLQATEQATNQQTDRKPSRKANWQPSWKTNW
jgi:hypothetical protein